MGRFYGIIIGFKKIQAKTIMGLDTPEESLLGTYHQLLSEKLESSPESVRFGPTYSVKTLKGESLSVSTVFFVEEGQDDFTRPYLLIAKNSEGEIVGIKTISVSDTVEVVTEIDVLEEYRGKGISTAIELVFLDLMQKYANEKQVDVNWEVTNTNLERLEKVREQYRSEIDSLQLADLKKLEMEQKRWRNNWGDGGKMGLTGGKRVFSPNNSPTDLETIKSVELRRDQVEGGKEILATLVGQEILPDQKDAVREGHFSEFMQLLEKMNE